VIPVFYIIVSTFFAVLVFGYLADPNTHYTCYDDTLNWGLFCFFFPQVATWVIDFTLVDLVGASVLAIYGMWIVFFYSTSVFNSGVGSK